MLSVSQGQPGFSVQHALATLASVSCHQCENLYQDYVIHSNARRHRYWSSRFLCMQVPDQDVQRSQQQGGMSGSAALQEQATLTFEQENRSLIVSRQP